MRRDDPSPGDILQPFLLLPLKLEESVLNVSLPITAAVLQVNPDCYEKTPYCGRYTRLDLYIGQNDGYNRGLG